MKKVTFVNKKHNTTKTILTGCYVDPEKAKKVRNSLCPDPIRCNICDGVIDEAYINKKRISVVEYTDGSIRLAILF